MSDNKKAEGHKKEAEEEEITFCVWTTHKGIRCCLKTRNKNKFCVKHTVLKNDFILLSPEKVKEKKIECISQKDVKFVPRSVEHIKNMMAKLVYEDTNSVDILCEGGVVITGDISNEDYIEINGDQSKFYYKSIRGQGKVKDIKVILVDFCKREPIISVNEETYCKDCYITLAKKRGYPTLKTLV